MNEALLLSLKKFSGEQEAPVDNTSRGKRSKTGQRFNSKSEQQSNVEKRFKSELETFDIPKPNLPEKQANKSESGVRYHGAGFLGRNRKKRQRQAIELYAYGDQDLQREAEERIERLHGFC